jgi:hypothetical protein
MLLIVMTVSLKCMKRMKLEVNEGCEGSWLVSEIIKGFHYLSNISHSHARSKSLMSVRKAKSLFLSLLERRFPSYKSMGI